MKFNICRKRPPSAPQKFLYKTRLGFGLSIQGTGESVGQRSLDNGESTSALKFASDDWKSLIKTGSGYWRYVPVKGGLRFITWYDYSVRFGAPGKLFDRLCFRPLIGWATAWSFDALRLWAEQDQPGNVSVLLSMIHAIARLSIAAVWLWHGLVPKLLFSHSDEHTMLREAGVSTQLLPWIGVAEILFAITMIASWRFRSVLIANAILMFVTAVGVAIKSPEFIVAAFNPVTLNGSVMALSIIGFLAAHTLPSASRCFRTKPQEES